VLQDVTHRASSVSLVELGAEIVAQRDARQDGLQQPEVAAVGCRLADADVDGLLLRVAVAVLVAVDVARIGGVEIDGAAAGFRQSSRAAGRR
jgi:hypothetical protein